MTSKYKNPDKFIKNLKLKLARVEKHRDNMIEEIFSEIERRITERGQFQFKYTKSGLHTIGTKQNHYGFKVGDTIIEIGEIFSVFHDKTGTDIKIKPISVRTRDKEYNQ